MNFLSVRETGGAEGKLRDDALKNKTLCNCLKNGLSFFSQVLSGGVVCAKCLFLRKKIIKTLRRSQNFNEHFIYILEYDDNNNMCTMY